MLTDTVRVPTCAAQSREIRKPQAAKTAPIAGLPPLKVDGGGSGILAVQATTEVSAVISAGRPVTSKMFVGMDERYSALAAKGMGTRQNSATARS